MDYQNQMYQAEIEGENIWLKVLLSRGFKNFFNNFNIFSFHKDIIFRPAQA